jgi:hypothetical protein
MTFVATNRYNNAARGSITRAAAELVNVNAALDLSTALSAAGIATATVTSQAKIVNTLNYTINGAFKTKAATDNFWTLSGTTVATGLTQKYALLIDAAGAASVQEATQALTAATVGWANVSSVGPWAPLLSILNASKAVAGVLTVVTVTNPFIPGTTLLGAAGVTATYQDGIDPTLFPLIGNEQGIVFGLGG